MKTQVKKKNSSNFTVIDIGAVAGKVESNCNRRELLISIGFSGHKKWKGFQIDSMLMFSHGMFINQILRE